MEHINLVISGVFSPIKRDQEDEAAKFFEEKFKEAGVKYTLTSSCELSQLGLLERESASLMNASLKQLAEKTIFSFQEALKKLELMQCKDRILLTQNDGTLILGSTAVKYPVFTFSSGPTNSLRGASELTNLRDAIVVDIGGTSTDVAVLEKGFPRPASAYVNIGGVRTNFRMPDTYCIALGGGSIVKFDEEGKCTIGPQSVGYKLKREARVFGGEILTTTDVAIAAGVFDIEGAEKSKVGLTEEQIAQAMELIVRMVEDAVDMIKTSGED